MQITIDKIASVTQNARLKHKVEITGKIKSVEGQIIAVEVLEDKSNYNQLELASGRLSKITKGDILAVALGNRRALKGFVGNVPEKLKVDDVINILNLGGVAGVCTSENFQEVGHALKVRVLGAITRNGKSLNIADFKLFAPAQTLKSKIPLIIISGTCMNVGKTSAACEIIKHAARKGYTVYAAKLAGIAAQRDTEHMKDHGAKKAVSVIDGGSTSTVNKRGSVEITKGAINYLSKGKPDFIVIEFGDGVFGEYGVMDILKDKEIQSCISAHVGCAHDPMGATKIYETCHEIGAELDLISGPVTDNSVGSAFVAKILNIPAYNALTQSEKLFNTVIKKCLKK